jgi:hypothetical protein
MNLGLRSATTADGPRSISFWLVLSIINPLSFPHKIDLRQCVSVFSPKSPLKAGLLIRQMISILFPGLPGNYCPKWSDSKTQALAGYDTQLLLVQYMLARVLAYSHVACVPRLFSLILVSEMAGLARF